MAGTWVEEEHIGATRTQDEHREAKLVAIVFLCFTCFLGVDFLAPMIFDGGEAIPAIVAVNLVVGQLTLICVWGTLVHGTFWIRLPWTLFLLTIAWICLSAGVSWDSGAQSSAEMLGLGVVWFYGFLVSFIPLKVAARWFRWRIIRAGSRKGDADEDQFAIRDMMIGTAMLAGTMAAARIMLPDTDVTLTEAIQASEFDDAGFFFLLAVFGVASLLIKMPCIWIALAAKKDEILRKVINWSVYCVVVSLLEFFFLCTVLGSPGSDWLEILFGMLFGHLALGVVVLSVLLLLRRLGYQLQCAQQYDDEPNDVQAVINPTSLQSR